jgi:hypothetical protein
LVAAGEASDNCTLLAAGLGQTGSLATNASSLFLTAANSEVLRYDLASGEMRSLVTGLSFPGPLFADEETLHVVNDTGYFESCGTGGWNRDIRSLSVEGGAVTLLTDSLFEVIDLHVLDDSMVFGESDLGTTNWYSLPRSGGIATLLGVPEAEALFVLDDEFITYDSREDALVSTPRDGSGASTRLAENLSASTIFRTDDGYYYTYSAFVDGENLTELRRVPLAGGEPQPIKLLDVRLGSVQEVSGGYIYANVAHVGGQVTMTSLVRVALSTGDVTELISLEPNELRDVRVIGDTVYAVVGSFGPGGLLRVDVP